MSYIPIYSPVNGVISEIKNNNITISIRSTDDHSLYAPLSGTLDGIVNTEGSWTRNVFQAIVNKIGRADIRIWNDRLNIKLNLWLEVGKPKYITDRIRLTKKINDHMNYR